MCSSHSQLVAAGSGKRAHEQHLDSCMLVVADCSLPTVELFRLDEPAECCAILPRAQGGP